jgi:hypothetical protein
LTILIGRQPNLFLENNKGIFQSFAHMLITAIFSCPEMAEASEIQTTSRVAYHSVLCTSFNDGINKLLFARYFLSIQTYR